MSTKTKNGPADIREGLPVATKGGTSNKPVWTIDGQNYEFIGPANKAGYVMDNSAGKLKKVRVTPKRVLAKFDAGKTAKAATLWFVGLFTKAAD